MRTVRSSSHLLLGGAWSGGCLVLGGAWSWGCLVPGGGVLVLGLCLPAYTEADSPPRGQTDRCKNITFTTSLQMVKFLLSLARTASLPTLCTDLPIEIINNRPKKDGLLSHRSLRKLTSHSFSQLNWVFYTSRCRCDAVRTGSGESCPKRRRLPRLRH